MITWYTQPEKSFASFYYYESTTRELVRIRLELGRTEGNGYPTAIYTPNRYIGFFEHDYLLSAPLDDSETMKDYRINDDQILIHYKDKWHTLEDKPRAGYWVHDVTSINGKTLNDIPHWGNSVSITPRLPASITEYDLRALALTCLDVKSSIKLAAAAAGEEELAQAIRDTVTSYDVQNMMPVHKHKSKNQCCQLF
jgi:hypothetical protein